MEYKKVDNLSKVCAVVKADGYGIGAKNVVHAIDDYVDFYAVACFVEAAKLRKLTKKNILVLNTVRSQTLKFCADSNISISLYSFDQAVEIAKQKKIEKIKVHIAINTGMNRVGFSSVEEFEKTLKYIKSNKSKIVVEGIFTHFYNAASEADTKKQYRIFMQYLNVLAKYYDASKIIKHACASLAAVKYSSFRLDMVRLGILLYGDIDESNILSLKPVLKIKSKVVGVTNVKAGQSVGYGKGFVAKNNLIVATVPLGYADGIMRAFAKSGTVCVNGNKCKVAGNICMDMFMIDVTEKGVHVGDTVEIIGKNQTAGDIASCCNTISYEILTNIKKNRFNVKIIKK